MRLKISILTLFVILISFNTLTNKSYCNVRILNNHNITYNDVYYEIIKKDIKFPNVVFAQSLIETGYFTSDLFIKENNLFGMKYPRTRKTTAVGISKNGYASYNDWSDSVEDYMLWQQNMIESKKDISESEYLELLSRVYAEDKNYVNQIKKIIYN